MDETCEGLPQDEAQQKDARAQAAAIWEDAEEGEIQGGFMQSIDTTTAPRVQTQQHNTATPGKVIGKVKSKRSLDLLQRGSMDADLPFTRTLGNGGEVCCSFQRDERCRGCQPAS